MMTTAALLEDLSRRGIEVAAIEGRLRLRPADRIPPDVLETVAARKQEVLCLLSEREHRQFVGDALQEFPGATLPDVAQADLQAFRELANRCFPELSNADRLFAALCGLGQAVAELDAHHDVVGAARARGVWFLLEQMCDAWRAHK